MIPTVLQLEWLFNEDNFIFFTRKIELPFVPHIGMILELGDAIMEFTIDMDVEIVYNIDHKILRIYKTMSTGKFYSVGSFEDEFDTFALAGWEVMDYELFYPSMLAAVKASIVERENEQQRS
jgi:hypothetical protein